MDGGASGATGLAFGSTTSGLDRGSLMVSSHSVATTVLEDRVGGDGGRGGEDSFVR